MQEEIWKDIPGYEGMYQVSDAGRVRKIKSKFGDYYIMSQALNNSGYTRVAINDVHMYVHRLVAITFIPNPQSKPCVNHKNGVKIENHLDNLEWCTYSENMRHAFATGLTNKSSLENLKNHVSEIRKPVVSICLKTGDKVGHKSIKDCARYLNRTRPAVSRASKYGWKCNNHQIVLTTN